MKKKEVSITVIAQTIKPKGVAQRRGRNKVYYYLLVGFEVTDVIDKEIPRACNQL